MIALALTLQAVAPAECAPGVHLVTADGSLQPLADQQTSHRKMAGLLGYALLGGMTSLKVKTVLPGKAAATRVPPGRPVFLLCAAAVEAQPTQGGGMGYVGPSVRATAPSELRLVRFDVAGDQREVPLSAMSITGPKTGAIEKTTVRFSAEELGPGRYRMTPQQDLTAGEYGFMKTVGNTTMEGGKKAAQERVYDFAVD